MDVYKKDRYYQVLTATQECAFQDIAFSMIFMALELRYISILSLSPRYRNSTSLHGKSLHYTLYGSLNREVVTEGEYWICQSVKEKCSFVEFDHLPQLIPELKKKCYIAMILTSFCVGLHLIGGLVFLTFFPQSDRKPVTNLVLPVLFMVTKIVLILGLFSECVIIGWVYSRCVLEHTSAVSILNTCLINTVFGLGFLAPGAVKVIRFCKLLRQRQLASQGLIFPVQQLLDQFHMNHINLTKMKLKLSIESQNDGVNALQHFKEKVDLLFCPDPNETERLSQLRINIPKFEWEKAHLKELKFRALQDCINHEIVPRNPSLVSGKSMNPRVHHEDTQKREGHPPAQVKSRENVSSLINVSSLSSSMKPGRRTKEDEKSEQNTLINIETKRYDKGVSFTQSNLSNPSKINGLSFSTEKTYKYASFDDIEVVDETPEKQKVGSSRSRKSQDKEDKNTKRKKPSR